MKIEISANKRKVQGTGASRRLRIAGRVPGIVYGGTQPPVNIEFEHKDLYQKLKMEAFHASILTLDLEGDKQQVLLRAFNMHPFKLQVAHVDFQRVSKDKEIHMKVPLHFVNAEISAGVKEQGGVASHVLNELDVSCLPDDLPEFIEVDLSGMSVGKSIHVKELKLPKGVAAVLRRNENPVVATLLMPQLQTEEDLAADADAVPAASEVPTSKQEAKPADAVAADDKGGDKGDKGDKKEKGDKGDKKDKGGDKKDKK